MIQLKSIFCAFFIVSVSGLSQDNVEIQCVPLWNCQKLLNLLRHPPISQKTITTLRMAQCGFAENNPKVWCPIIRASTCQTPDGQSGKCTPVRECEPFLLLLKPPHGLSLDVVSHLQKYQCKEPGLDSTAISICCPTEQKSIVVKEPIVDEEEPLPIPLPLANIPANEEEEPSDVRPQNPPSFLPRAAAGECGLQLIDKIIGGKVTEMNEFPWTALLEYRLRGRVSTPCAGTLISNKYVVTAAHCTDSNAVRSAGIVTNVILGEFDTRTARDCINNLGIEDCADPPLKVPVEKVILHDQWYTKPKAQINHDIALLRLAESVRFTDYIKPICLPSSTLTVREKENLVVTGWGRTEQGVPSFVKLKTTIAVANRNQCIQKYKEDKKVVVGEGEICVGGKEGSDSCSGDSGGPLMLSVDRSGSTIWFLAGVVSFGSNQPCGIKDYPALYTYLPKYIDWLYKNVEP